MSSCQDGAMGHSENNPVSALQHIKRAPLY